jgi:polysaccharide biosynthesis PFTS motif protein
MCGKFLRKSSGYSLLMMTIADDIEFLTSRGESGNRNSLLPRCLDRFLRQVIVVGFAATAIFMMFFIRIFIKRAEMPQLIFHSLTHDQAFPKNSSSAFTDFIQSERFDFGCENREILLEIRSSKGHKDSEVATTRNLSLHIMTRCSTWPEFAIFVRNLAVATWCIVKSRQMQVKSIKYLIRTQIESSVWKSVSPPRFFITTQSCMQNLPIPFYLSGVKFQKLMMWYSTNNRPVLRADEQFTPHSNSSELQNFVDLHLVWNEEEKAWLNLNGVSKSKVVGSIIFRPQLKVSCERKLYDMVYFDVTAIPRNDIFMSEEMLISNLTVFSELLDIMGQKTSRIISGFIKPKRKDQKIHSSSYLELRNDLVSRGVIHALDPESDLYEIISRSKVVLAAPFTSPANIARELGVPVAYFCLLTRDYRLGDEVNGIPILRSFIELEEFLSQVFKD